MVNAPFGAFCNTCDLHQAIIGLEKQFLVFFRVAVLDRFYCNLFLFSAKVIFHTFVVICRLFSKLPFSKNYFRNTIRVSNSLDPDQDRPDILSVLFLVQTVCKGYQQTKRLLARKELKVRISLSGRSRGGLGSSLPPPPLPPFSSILRK